MKLFKSKVNLSLKLLFSSALFLPLISFAQTPTNFKGIVLILIGIVQTATRVMVLVAVFYFIWGVAKYVFSAGDETKVEEGKKIMIWGIVGLFAISSVWGLVFIIQATFLPSETTGAVGTFFWGNYTP